MDPATESSGCFSGNEAFPAVMPRERQGGRETFLGRSGFFPYPLQRAAPGSQEEAPLLRDEIQAPHCPGSGRFHREPHGQAQDSDQHKAPTSRHSGHPTASCCALSQAPEYSLAPLPTGPKAEEVAAPMSLESRSVSFLKATLLGHCDFQPRRRGQGRWRV